jgi:cysteinyl-tRNA synthetase
MNIFIQNSLTKKREAFIPIVPPKVNIYTCGVTVYDDCHVGHARSLFVFTVLKKYLEYRGYKVRLVRNITDVDDKIINRAREEKVSFNEIRLRYIKNYYRDLKDLEIEKADFEPLATENINYMVYHIRQLIQKGFAYEVDGDVYFSVRSFADYGKLSGQSLDEMLTAVRIEKDEKKRDPLDFALWKKSKEGEPSWGSPWGRGRPGWHIECSTMSMRFLRTQRLDIHAGGRDLIFPHHENEIAQSEALTGQPFAAYWMHHGLLTIDGKKMSKSLGNFVTIQDVLKKYTPNVLKLFFLSAHYGSPMDFTFEVLEKTKRGYAKIEEFINKTAFLKKKAKVKSAVPGAASEGEVRRLVHRFEEAMDDDFNTAQALAVLFELLTLGNKYLMSKQTEEAVLFVCQVLIDLGKVLGLNLAESSGQHLAESLTETLKASDSAEVVLTSPEIEKLIADRREARQKKDFKRADEIRDHLKKLGVTVQDKEKMS